MRVIIENQLGRTNHDHLGKTITYASGLDAKIIIWIAREFSEEHRRAIDFLNEHAAPNLRLFALEMQLWRIGDSLPAPMFRVVASPNDYTSAIKIENDELSETQTLYPDYRTENMYALGNSLQRLTEWLGGQQCRDEEPFWDRHGLLKTAREQAQPQPKQAQVAAVLPMQPFAPGVAKG